VRSTTIIGPDAVLTDALSTSVFVMGVDQGLRLIATLPDYEGIVIDAEGRNPFAAEAAPTIWGGHPFAAEAAPTIWGGHPFAAEAAPTNQKINVGAASAANNA
jgi:hypothetical protein